jgi:hypothetical protein
VINPESDPVGWTFFLDELEDASEHLRTLIKELSEDQVHCEEDFRIGLGHVFAHLNRAWRRRLVHEDFSDEEWEMAGRFPDDLDPIA